LARRSGLADRVQLAGRVTDKLKYGYLSAADAFVLSSEHEGFGVVLQEAMAAGLPVVAVGHGGQADLLEDGVNALLVDSNEPRGLAGAVQRVLTDSELRAAMCEANRRKLKAYDASAMAQRYVQLFREAVASAGSGRLSAWQRAGRLL
jgi:glycosyltransferase involved in cell wall biosynthesis